MKKDSLKLSVLKETTFKLEERLTGETLGAFYSWLDKYDDFCGKYLLDNISDLVEHIDSEDEDIKRSMRQTFEKLKPLLFQRLDEFIKEKSIDPSKQFLDSLREKQELRIDLTKK